MCSGRWCLEHNRGPLANFTLEMRRYTRILQWSKRGTFSITELSAGRFDEAHGRARMQCHLKVLQQFTAIFNRPSFRYGPVFTPACFDSALRISQPHPLPLKLPTLLRYSRPPDRLTHLPYKAPSLIQMYRLPHPKSPQLCLLQHPLKLYKLRLIAPLTRYVDSTDCHVPVVNTVVCKVYDCGMALKAYRIVSPTVFCTAHDCGTRLKAIVTSFTVFVMFSRCGRVGFMGEKSLRLTARHGFASTDFVLPFKCSNWFGSAITYGECTNVKGVGLGRRMFLIVRAPGHKNSPHGEETRVGYIEETIRCNVIDRGLDWKMDIHGEGRI